MPRIFMAAGQYVQGPGCLDLVGQRAAAMGRRAAFVCDAEVLPLVEERVRTALDEAGIPVAVLPFHATVTHLAIDQLTEAARGAQTDVVIGAGGRRAIVAANGVARRLAPPFVSIPTIASTDAPASRGIAVYDDAHNVVEVEQLARNPDCVLVDTALIAGAPARFPAAGIGDAVTKTFEAQACWAAQANTKHGTPPLRAAGIIAEACYLRGTSSRGGRGRGRRARRSHRRRRGNRRGRRAAQRHGFRGAARGGGRGPDGFPSTSRAAAVARGARRPGSHGHRDRGACHGACMTNPHARNQPVVVDSDAIAAAIRTVERRAAAFGANSV